MLFPPVTEGGPSSSLKSLGLLNITWKIKCSLNVLIARSAVLQKCVTCGVSWKYMSLDRSSLQKSWDTLLSSFMYDGLSPLDSRHLWISFKTQMNLFYF